MPDFWTHFVELRRLDFARVLACYQSWIVLNPVDLVLPQGINWCQTLFIVEQRQETENEKYRSWNLSTKFFEGYLVYLLSASFTLSSSSGSPYPIGVIGFPRLWAEVLMLVYFWSQFIELSMCEFSKPLHYSQYGFYYKRKPLKTKSELKRKFWLKIFRDTEQLNHIRIYRDSMQLILWIKHKIRNIISYRRSIALNIIQRRRSRVPSFRIRRNRLLNSYDYSTDIFVSA